MSRLLRILLTLALVSLGLLAIQTPAFAAAPVASNDSMQAVQNTPAGVDLTVDAVDPDADPLTYAIVTPPAHGTLDDCSSGFCTYTPAANYVGADSFTWKANDGTADSNVATMSITVVADPNGPAIVSAGPLTKVQISPLLNCAVDHTGDSAGEFFGDTACGTFAVVDGVMYSPASIPAGSPGTAYTPISQTGVTGAGTQADPYKIVTTVGLGGTGVQLVQTDSYVVGQESYRTDVQVKNSATARTVRLYRAADCYLAGSDSGIGVAGPSGAVACKSATSERIEQWLPLSSGSHYYEAFYSTVWSQISSMAAFPDTCECATDQDNGAGLQWDVVLAASASDTRSSLITFSPVGALPLSTTKTVDQSSVANGGTVTYTITVSNPGATPAAVTDISDTLPAGFSYQTGTTTGATTSNPTDASGTLHWAVSSSVPAGGTITLSFSATASSTPGTYYNNAGATATGLFVNPTGDTAPVTVTGPVNHVPNAVDDSVTTPEDTSTGPISVLGNDTDVDGDTLSITGHTNGVHGTVSCTSTTCTYVPAANFNGSDSFTYTISDGHGGTDTATVSVTVTPVNDAPNAVDDTVNVITGTATPVNVLANDTDADGDTLSITTASPTAGHGTVTCSATGCTYTSTVGFIGDDTFTYAISDGHGGTDTATVTLHVAANHAPNAVDDSATTAQDTSTGPIPVLANDTDADGDTLVISGKTDGAHGTVSCTTTTCTYVPAAGWSGTDAFTYTVSDGHGGTDTATVTVTVNAPIVSGPTCTITGTPGDDVLVGTNHDDVICGLGGNDRIIGKRGNDILYGGDGNDRLMGLGGNDLLDGGPGTDTVQYSALMQSVRVNLGLHRATGQGVDTLVSIENVDGSPLADVLIGDAFANLLRGLSGNDAVNGGPGDDVLVGGGGKDRLRGSGGNDTLRGGAGRDSCNQGGGKGLSSSC